MALERLTETFYLGLALDIKRIGLLYQTILRPHDQNLQAQHAAVVQDINLLNGYIDNGTPLPDHLRKHPPDQAQPAQPLSKRPGHKEESVKATVVQKASEQPVENPLLLCRRKLREKIGSFPLIPRFNQPWSPLTKESSIIHTKNKLGFLEDDFQLLGEKFQKFLDKQDIPERGVCFASMGGNTLAVVNLGEPTSDNVGGLTCKLQVAALRQGPPTWLSVDLHRTNQNGIWVTRIQYLDMMHRGKRVTGPVYDPGEDYIIAGNDQGLRQKGNDLYYKIDLYHSPTGERRVLPIQLLTEILTLTSGKWLDPNDMIPGGSNLDILLQAVRDDSHLNGFIPAYERDGKLILLTHADPRSNPTNGSAYINEAGTNDVIREYRYSHGIPNLSNIHDPLQTAYALASLDALLKIKPADKQSQTPEMTLQAKSAPPNQKQALNDKLYTPPTRMADKTPQKKSEFGIILGEIIVPKVKDIINQADSQWPYIAIINSISTKYAGMLCLTDETKTQSENPIYTRSITITIFWEKDEKVIPIRLEAYLSYNKQDNNITNPIVTKLIYKSGLNGFTWDGKELKGTNNNNASAIIITTMNNARSFDVIDEKKLINMIRRSSNTIIDYFKKDNLELAKKVEGAFTSDNKLQWLQWDPSESAQILFALFYKSGWK